MHTRRRNFLSSIMSLRLARTPRHLGSRGLVALGLFFTFAVASFAAESAGRVSVARVPAGLQPRKAQPSADGAIHVLCDSDSGPQYVKSRDGGRTFRSEERRVGKEC